MEKMVTQTQTHRHTQRERERQTDRHTENMTVFSAFCVPSFLAAVYRERRGGMCAIGLCVA